MTIPYTATHLTTTIPQPVQAALIALAGIAFFVGFFSFIIFIISRPWSGLVHSYGATEEPPGKWFKGVSGRIGWVNYNNCLRVVVSPSGIYLSVSFPFSLFHPPLLLPWITVTDVQQKKILFWSYTVVTIMAGTSKVTLTLSKGAGEEVGRMTNRME